jgi:predicted nucleic-acid-binding Zn-ribbon protein
MIKCQKCGNEFEYSEEEDKRFESVITSITGRKVIVDDDENVVAFYSIPPDKQNLIGDQFIHFRCKSCLNILKG